MSRVDGLWLDCSGLHNQYEFVFTGRFELRLNKSICTLICFTSFASLSLCKFRLIYTSLIPCLVQLIVKIVNNDKLF